MIKLRKFSKDDAESIVANADNPKVATYLKEIFPSPYTLSVAKWWVSEGCQSNESCSRAIDIEGVCIGSVGVNFQKAEHRYSAELGYWLGEAYWNRGIATFAIEQFTKHVFTNYDIRRIYAPVVDANRASMRILEKCGYQCEGVMKNSLFLRGEIYDEHIYAIHS